MSGLDALFTPYDHLSVLLEALKEKQAITREFVEYGITQGRGLHLRLDLSTLCPYTNGGGDYAFAGADYLISCSLEGEGVCKDLKDGTSTRMASHNDAVEKIDELIKSGHRVVHNPYIRWSKCIALTPENFAVEYMRQAASIKSR